MWHKRPLFALKYHCPALQAFKPVPDTLGYINSITSILSTEHNAFYHGTIIIVGGRTHLSSKDNKRFILCRMTMYRNISSRLHGIEHTMALIIEALMKVVVHPKPWRCLRLCRNLIK